MLINAQEAARRLQVSDRHVRWLCAVGVLPHRRRGRKIILIDEADLEAVRYRRRRGRPPKARPPAWAEPAPLLPALEQPAPPEDEVAPWPWEDQ